MVSVLLVILLFINNLSDDFILFLYLKYSLQLSEVFIILKAYLLKEKMVIICLGYENTFSQDVLLIPSEQLEIFLRF